MSPYLLHLICFLCHPAVHWVAHVCAADSIMSFKFLDCSTLPSWYFLPLPTFSLVLLSGSGSYLRNLRSNVHFVPIHAYVRTPALSNNSTQTQIWNDFKNTTTKGHKQGGKSACVVFHVEWKWPQHGRKTSGQSEAKQFCFNLDTDFKMSGKDSAIQTSTVQCSIVRRFREWRQSRWRS